ncbi:MAG TPA: hypothetical protein VHT91_28865 [Kofleriaceae bacterium]|jgi:hypothetical protein|nr:hypothetical protein [Kofleriaceae bacterium]
MEALALAGPAAIADALLLQRGAWVLVVARQSEIIQSVSHIKAELDFLLVEEQEGVGGVKTIEAATSSAELMATLSHYSEDDIILITGIERFDQEQLERLDLFRNRALRSPRVLIVTTPEGADRLSTHSPNLLSWLGAHCLQYDSEEGRMNVDERLQSLRDHFKMSDSEVIDLAERGALPSDVAFTEWLILLQRGDLFGS